MGYYTAIKLKTESGIDFNTGGYFKSSSEVEELRAQLQEEVIIDGDATTVFGALDSVFGDVYWNYAPMYAQVYFPPDYGYETYLLEFWKDFSIVYAGLNIIKERIPIENLLLNDVVVGSLGWFASNGPDGATRASYGTGSVLGNVSTSSGPLFPSYAPYVGGSQALVNFQAGSAGFRIFIFDDSIIKDGTLDLTKVEKDGEWAYIPYNIVQFSVDYTDKGKIIGGRISPMGDSSLRYKISLDAYAVYNGFSIRVVEDDPYSPGGTSGGGGGGGSFDGTTGNIDHPGLPNIQLTDTGFINLFNPSPAQLKQLADYMWSDTPNWDDFKKVLANPMDAIIGLLAVPVNVPPAQLKEIFIGNIPTGVFMTSASSQWVSHSCGSIVIPEYYGSYLDYSPYTSFQLYLPYIGMQQISANDIISHAGKSLSLQYNVDILSGACIATLKCGPDVLYDWQGSCGLQIPFTSLTYGNFLNGMLQVASGALSALANPVSGLSSMISGAVSMYHNDVSHGGSIAGSGGFLNIQTPYFIITRPNMCIPGNQDSYIGYPSFINVELSTLSGYTEIDSIHIENVPATSSELEEIEGLLKSGVIF